MCELKQVEMVDIEIKRLNPVAFSYLNDVTALGWRGCQGFCDDSNKVLLIKNETMGERCQKRSEIA